MRTLVLAGALAVAFVGGAHAHVITYTQSFNGGSGVSGGSDFQLGGTSGSPTLNLTPGVSQAAFLDFSITVSSNNSTGVFTGTATGTMTIDGVTRSVSDDFTFHSASGVVDFSGGPPVVFDLGTFQVTVTPILSADEREADFLETAIAAPEPASLALFGVGLAGLVMLRARRA